MASPGYNELEDRRPIRPTNEQTMSKGIWKCPRHMTGGQSRWDLSPQIWKKVKRIWDLSPSHIHMPCQPSVLGQGTWVQGLSRQQIWQSVLHTGQVYDPNHTLVFGCNVAKFPETFLHKPIPCLPTVDYCCIIVTEHQHLSTRQPFAQVLYSSHYGQHFQRWDVFGLLTCLLWKFGIEILIPTHSPTPNQTCISGQYLIQFTPTDLWYQWHTIVFMQISMKPLNVCLRLNW